ncbi:hypothetical protein MCOR27_000459 [Pyricularia oryzae]|uniref:Uncharacterized protein n=2 Tax=Pyricularia TaxID=48558 RepID=A0ABQ8NY85_PYRGI|nr:hypothetical protein MCOR01_009656 [Pyricularia oryzae]KAI6303857.1 hypothetical protein MCOR33_001028 [Pyricularia grisea]KAH9437071.1 hypothetical protein MCOR02_000728 [Pyricularia oryzae]KAI6261704.1 hypothetical protein MCOR19_002036 [Pyricularia oryzae]KAI6281314.1 hypothetical protein MCOR26_003327 [Pyricularia oryzae]
MAHHIFTRRAGDDSAAPAAQVPRRVLQRRSNPAYKHTGGHRAPQTAVAAAAAAAPANNTTTTTWDQAEEAGYPASMSITQRRQSQYQQHSSPSEAEPCLVPTASLSLSISPSGSPAPSVFSSTSGGGGFDSLLAHHMTGEQRELAARRRSGGGGGAEYGSPPRLWMLGRNGSGWGGGSAADLGGQPRPMRKLVKEPGTSGSGRPSFSLEIPGEDGDERRRGGRPRATTGGAEMRVPADERGGAGGLMRRRVVDRLFGLYRRGDR